MLRDFVRRICLSNKLGTPDAILDPALKRVIARFPQKSNNRFISEPKVLSVVASSKHKSRLNSDGEATKLRILACYLDIPMSRFIKMELYE